MTKLERKQAGRTAVLYAVMKETLAEIAASGKNSTRDRRNARATLYFVTEMERMRLKK